MKRAREERLAASRAPHARAQKAHLQMAEHYEGRINAAGLTSTTTEGPITTAN
ncbi:MAG TPA: hypothetical protein VM308_05105 [Sphingomicrobium sp.]|nr:hypothetical protein [Sphingomicrobium sp.]